MLKDELKRKAALSDYNTPSLDIHTLPRKVTIYDSTLRDGEQLAVVLDTMYGIDTGIDLTSLTKVCRRVSKISGGEISKNHPWVGANAFRHESGIHVASIMANPATYECVPLETMGAKRELVLGKHSGRIAVLQRLESMGVHVDDSDLKLVVNTVKEMAQEGERIDDWILLDIVKRCGKAK